MTGAAPVAHPAAMVRKLRDPILKGPAGERGFGRGDISVSAGHEIHRIHNRTDTDLVTVHIYSPPLGDTMKLFTPIPRSG